MEKHYRLGIKEVKTKTIISNAYELNKTPQKTVHNTLGIMVNSKHELETYSKLGFNMIAVGTEMNILSRSISQILE